MNFAEWDPFYRAILDDFGYPRSADEKSRDLLKDLLEDWFEPSCIEVSNQTVAIAGGSQTLMNDFHIVQSADVIFAAGGATEILRDQGYSIDVMVTDLDTNPMTAKTLTLANTPVVVHAHGDNREIIRSYLPTFDHSYILPTTQAKPLQPIQNFGGFTDGDRAAFLADAMDADTLIFPGWEFDDPSLSSEKRRKLDWAERLLYYLERKRGESFPILDGRRSEITLPRNVHS
ncbi:MAG: 6-hydroxymethylpterin diphosphokinase MptE-like protein [Halobacteriaceae archaeon]